MKIAVTAASGQLGGAIVKQLIQDNGKENTIGIARTPKNAEHLGVEIRKGDYGNREDLEAALQGIDAVLIVSGNDAPEKRIPLHRNVIEAAKAAGVRKIVYTSIIGDPEATAFSPVIKSNRQTEEDVKASGLEWAIGRNGLYIEPDLEYVDSYVKQGGVKNCAADGKCGYTSRGELARAYSKMLLEDQHNGKTYCLLGPPVAQEELVEKINQYWGTGLTYQPISVEEYIKERQAELGEFLGTVVAGIYDGIKRGSFTGTSHFEEATGRPHQSLVEMIEEFRAE